MKHALIFGGSYERNKGSSVYDGLLTDEETFGFPDFSYVNPVIPDRSLWMHDPSSVDFNGRHHRPVRSVPGRTCPAPRRDAGGTLRQAGARRDARDGGESRADALSVQPEGRRDGQAARQRHGSDWPHPERVRRVLAGVPATAAAERACRRRTRRSI